MVQHPLFIAWTRAALLRRAFQLAQRSFESAGDRIAGSAGRHSRVSAFQRVPKYGCRDSYLAHSEAAPGNDAKVRVTARAVVDVCVYRVPVLLAATEHVLQAFLSARTDTPSRSVTRVVPKQNLETTATRDIRHRPRAREFSFPHVPVFSSTTSSRHTTPRRQREYSHVATRHSPRREFFRAHHSTRTQ